MNSISLVPCHALFFLLLLLFQVFVACWIVIPRDISVLFVYEFSVDMKLNLLMIWSVNRINWEKCLFFALLAFHFILCIFFFFSSFVHIHCTLSTQFQTHLSQFVINSHEQSLDYGLKLIYLHIVHIRMFFNVFPKYKPLIVLGT